MVANSARDHGPSLESRQEHRAVIHGAAGISDRFTTIRAVLQRCVSLRVIAIPAAGSQTCQWTRSALGAPSPRGFLGHCYGSRGRIYWNWLDGAPLAASHETPAPNIGHQRQHNVGLLLPYSECWMDHAWLLALVPIPSYGQSCCKSV